MTAQELIGSYIKAKVRIHNVRYPLSGHMSGDYAVVVFDVVELLEGNFPDECKKITVFSDYQFVGAGPMPKLKEGADYVFEGKLVIKKNWGPQYEVFSMRFDYDLANETQKKAFLVMFTSETIADALLAGPYNPINLLDSKNIGELKKIKGIGPVTAARLCQRYEENKDHSRAYVMLRDLGLTKYIIDKLIERYKSPDILIDKIEANPYILIREVKGFGWEKCDAIAMRQGFTCNCKERVTAYIQFYLYDQSDKNGNSWVTLDDLALNVAAKCTPILNTTLAEWIKELIIKKADFEEYYHKIETGQPYPNINEMPLLYYDKEHRRIGLLELRILEKEIARHIKRLTEAPLSFKYDKKVVETIIKETEKEQGYEYTPEQIETIYQILDNNVSILTGLAGVGKTSTLAAVTKVFRKYKQKIEQCALSGRASSKLTELTHIPGKTIHRLLCYTPDSGQFAFTERHPLGADVVILDEASMVGGELYLSLISAIKTGARFIMVGDIHQLESIGLCNILKDCIKSGYVSSTVLTKIHRQAARSGIITQSLAISQGDCLVKSDFIGEETRGELRDFKIICSYSPDVVQANIIREFKRMLESGIKAEDIQIIVPMRNRGSISCRVLNEIVQEIVNPVNSKKDITIEFNEESIKYNVTFKVNDRIIVCKNNYHAMGVDGEEKQIFNGNVGYIKDMSEDIIMISLPEQGDVMLQKEDWHSIQLAYAITVHKKQGDSTPYAIVGLNTTCYALYSRELLYTAVTRARKFCTLVAQTSAVNAAVKRSKVTLKQTWLIDDLTELYIQQEEKKHLPPTTPTEEDY